MRKMILIASFTAALAAAAAPGLAQAGNACENDKHADKVTGTVVGAIGGALLGNLVAGHGHKSDGALVGAAGGAIVGNQLARSKEPCPPYGYGYGPGDRRIIAPTAPPPVYETYRRPGAYDRANGRYGEVERSDRVRYDERRSDRDGYGYDDRREDYGSGRDGDRDGYRGGYGRDCRIVVRSYVAPDGDYVTRRERVCR